MAKTKIQGLRVITMLAVLFSFMILPRTFGQSETANITGTVIDVTSKPITGVEIAVFASLDRSLTKTTTDNRGKYKISDLRPGSYSVFVTPMSHFKPAVTTVKLEKGATLEQNFTLDAMLPCPPVPPAGGADNGSECVYIK